MMKCNDLQADLALYGDDILSSQRTSAIETHFESCPMCRAKHAANLELLADLSQIERPQMPDALIRSLRLAVSTELRTGGRSTSWFSTDTVKWLQMRVMPYSVGVLASLVIGMGVLTFMFSSAQNAEDVIAVSPKPASSVTDLMLASNRGSNSPDEMIYPADYAKTRLAVSSQSPSLNPQGALVTLASSFVRENMKDEGVVVVADVFSNGLAKIQEIIDPSRNSKTIVDLEKALDADLGNAPFVPASLDGRSESVRVVLRFESVNVSTKDRPRNRRGL